MDVVPLLCVIYWFCVASFSAGSVAGEADFTHRPRWGSASLASKPPVVVDRARPRVRERLSCLPPVRERDADSGIHTPQALLLLLMLNSPGRWMCHFSNPDYCGNRFNAAQGVMTISRSG